MNTRLVAVVIFILVFIVPSFNFAQEAEDYNKTFLKPYRRLIDQKTEKAFKKIKINEEKDAFIEKFWKDRDLDPATAANEFKEDYDKKINDIENEIFAQDQDLKQFLFRFNGGLDGDAAWVYLLKGAPTVKTAILSNDTNYLTDLMLWIYIDTSGGGYRFLFYKDRGLGYFKLFDSYFGTLAERLEKISRFPAYGDPELIESVRSELWMAEYGGLFIDALYEFSTYGEYPHQVLMPPDPATLIAQKSGVGVVGISKLPDDQKYIFSNNFNSFLPAIFRLGKDKEGKIVSYILLKFSNVDWQIIKDGDQEKARAVFKLEMTFIIKGDRAVFVYEEGISTTTLVDVVRKAEPSGIFMINILNVVKSLPKLPEGEYVVYIYLRNEYSQKYNSWVMDFKN